MGRRARTAPGSGPGSGRIPAGGTLKMKKLSQRPLRFGCRLFLCAVGSSPQQQPIPSERFLAPSGDGSPPRVCKSRFHVDFTKGLDSLCGGATSRVAGELQQPLKFTAALLPRTGSHRMDDRSEEAGPASRPVAGSRKSRNSRDSFKKDFPEGIFEEHFGEHF